ncbi:hypothetical protein Mal4_50810 [Maioricimonas rarisocia]|uniref:BIG2 domain-containing protein n=2 Tax=Maioricimonas rarisocia TaxID=2528026 RepID=A0A517ZE10_9PLAN|nr:hypothetical protein Mal4_50810 [Maioricimonas rarisocia]
MFMTKAFLTTIASLAVVAACTPGMLRADDTLAPASTRFQSADTEETPDFQRHLVPLMGKLGCNGRACHGSFQGQGGFQLSLFGYDFEMDHENLLDRIDTDAPAESYALHKPTLQEPHEGGKRMAVDSWEYNLFLSWIRGGAAPRSEEAATLTTLEVTPREIRFSEAGQTQQLKAIAVWSDGTREDVTCLSRFQSNDTAICEITDKGEVTAGESGDTHVVVFYDNAVVPIPVLKPVSDRTGENYPQIATTTPIDEFVVGKLSKLGIIPSEVCSDEEFLRRVSLDLAGTLPTAGDVRAFLSDQSPDKRARKVEELLATPAYAAWWTTKLCDWTGNSDQQLNNINPARGNTASRDWYDWIHKRVSENVPYDKLVEGIVVANSRRPGESYREYCERQSRMLRDDATEAYADDQGLTYFWGRRNFRATEDRAIGFAYTFMGTRIQCAQCHKHPFDVWTQKDFQQFEQFFTRINFARNGSDRDEYKAILEELGVDKLRGGQQRRAIADAAKEGKTVPFPELVVQSPRISAAQRKKAEALRAKGKDVKLPGDFARLLGGESINLAEIEDPRTALMDWLRHDSKQLFAKAFVNRVWANYFNRGIVEPTDDLSLANPPCNQELLDYLARGFVENGYDMHWLHREICLSDTYQRSWQPNETNLHDERNFSRAVPRRLPAEVAIDALAIATVSDEKAARFLEEIDRRSLGLPGVPRNRSNGAYYALSVFGRSTRESNCDCDRSSEASLLQTVFVRNDETVHELIDRRDGWITQLARGSSSKSANRREDSRKADAIRQRMERIEQALNRARKQGNEKQIGLATRQLKGLRKQLAELEPQKSANVDLDVASVVDEAYLRTLSRLPNEDERAIASEFVASSENPIAGARGLLWTLINTKEFLVNH